MHAYRCHGPVRVLVEADAPVSGHVADESGTEVARFEAVPEGGAAFVEFEPPRLGRYRVMADGAGARVATVDYREEPYFTADELRAYDDGSKLSEDVSDAFIEAVRDHVEAVFDRAAGTPFVACGAFERTMGTGSARIRTARPMPIRAVRVLVDGREVDGAAARGMGFDMPAPVPRGSRVELWYEHGYEDPPAALLHNALVYANSIVGSPSVNPRATGAQAEFGYMRFAVAGKDGATGIPEVDAFLSSDPSKGGFGVRRAVVA